jgi:outer membrane phospholipase A
MVYLYWNWYYNFLGFNEYFSFGYTQKSFWNAYAYSSPFRDLSRYILIQGDTNERFDFKNYG